MPKSVPTPVAAAIGIVPTVVDTVRAIPGKAVQLPVLAVSSALTALETARKEYDELAERGEKLVARLRGTSFDEFEDRIEHALKDTPLATPYDVIEDAAEDAVAKVSELLDRAANKTPAKPARVAVAKVTPEPAAAASAAEAEVPAAEAPKGEPTPAAPTGSVERVATAATPEVVEVVEAVALASTAPTVTDHDALPLPDYDHMTLGSLRGRLRALSVDQLVQVRDYEKAHADRLPVVTLLDNRISKLATDAAATPSVGGGEAPVTPAPAGAGKVSAAQAATPSTQASSKASTKPASTKPASKAAPRTKVRST